VTRPSAREVEQVAVFRNAERVGTLERTAHGSRFEYDADFFERHRALPGGIARHLPYARRTTETHGVNLHPYFAGLLPEGLRLRAMVARLKTSEDDLFSLLVAAGNDCVGDLFVVRAGERPSLDEETLVVSHEASFAELWAKTLEADTHPLVSGVQDKLSPSLMTLPVRTRGRRWLLKLSPPDTPELVDNEFFFMQLAAKCLKSVARVERVHDRTGVAGLLVARFDRVRDSSGRWVGVHQEDACQLLNRYPADKYRLSTKELFQALEVCDAPVVARLRLIELIAYSYLIGNGDLHGKNVSVGAQGGVTQLTPAYDLLTTRPYGDKRLALPVEGRDDNLKRHHLVALSERFGITEAAVAPRLDALCSQVEAAVPMLSTIGLDTTRTKTLSDLLLKRVDDLRAPHPGVSRRGRAR
jgi:serine/threonine-protein kinase HipA